MADPAVPYVYNVTFYDWEDSEVMGVYARLEDAEEHVKEAARKGDEPLTIEKHEVLATFPGLARRQAYATCSRAKGWRSWREEGPALPLPPLQPGPWPLIASSAAIPIQAPLPPAD